jgi:UDP-2-acetamido-3-amino-2,3-dideoxy-glucuronate N-acetyltransferase
MNIEPRTRNHELGTTNREQRTTNLDALRIAILGAGGWGKNHVRVFCELLGPDRVVVCDTDPDRRADAERAHPGVSTCAAPDFASIDAAIVATPVSTHFSIARELLSHDVHVLVEKPIALRAGEAEELIGLAAQRKRILMVDHLMEYHPAVLELRRLIDDGALGRVLHVMSQRSNLGVIRSEENALWSLAPHDVSVLLFLLGEEPEAVTAHGGAFLQRGVEDVCYLTMRFPSGTVGHIHSSWLDPVKTRRLTVVGDRRMAVFDDGAPDPLLLYEHRIRPVDGRYVTEPAEPVAVEFDRAEPLRLVARAFLDSVRTGSRPAADGEDGLRVVRVLERAQEALGRW